MMLLSDAIKLGAMLRPQGFGSYGKFGSCAIRAACDALGIVNRNGLLNYPELERRYPFLRDVTTSPEPDMAPDRIMCVIYILNDVHKWTRERIADWVATIEPVEGRADVAQEATGAEAC